MAGFRFLRQYEVTLARVLPGSFSRTAPNAVVIRDMRISFDIEKTLEDDPNPATLTIWNLAPDTRAAVTVKPVQIRIQAGYRDEPIETLFLGDLKQAQTYRDGSDVLTKILIADGERCMNARVSTAFGAGTTARAQIGTIAGKMGLAVPRNVNEAKEFVQSVASGKTLQGPARGAMTNVVRKLGGKWSVQDGQLQILLGNDVRADQALVIAEESGMIGSPEFGAPNDKGDPPTLTVRHYLYPQCKPGGKVFVQGEFVRGLFRIEKVKHSGDSHSGDWLTTLECKPL